ncbi:MAG TPA: type 1 glutamine amidotransferase domain-containing protein [Candidatus Acidoferrales bacterium]|nr:type 1 glutamine amidotransferase domain-containing protein [Candidatus Acidoferrales bacterium]
MTHPLPLHGLRVAILVEDGFEQVEMTGPRDALRDAGAVTEIVSPKKDTVRGYNHEDPADEFKVDATIAEADPMNYDALLLPGGVRNPDALRIDNKSVLFVHAMETAKKPIAAICHGPWMLVETGYVRGRTLTSWPSLRTDIVNAGGNWVDEPVVKDELLVTSRNPGDIPRFNKAMVELFTPTAQAVAG